MAHWLIENKPDFGKRFVRACALLVISATVGVGGGCQTVSTKEAVDRTFDYGQAYLPAQATKDGKPVKYRVAAIDDAPLVAEETPDKYREFTGSWLKAAGERIVPGTRWPVVVFLHGCTGYAHYSSAVAEYYVAAGALVVLPNSFARPGREEMCYGNMSLRESLRHAEARAAFQRLATQSWVDSNRIVLAGQSEGGNATASYSGNEFAAHIITGVSCKHNGGTVSAPANTPVLAIKGDEDQFYPGGETCALRRSVGGSRSILLSGQGHMALLTEEAKAAIYKFLNECCGIGSGS